VSRYGAPRSAASPSAVKSAPTPGLATSTRSRGKPRVSAKSSAVNAEFAKTTLHVRAALRYFLPCIACVRFVVHCG